MKRQASCDEGLYIGLLYMQYGIASHGGAGASDFPGPTASKICRLTALRQQLIQLCHAALHKIAIICVDSGKCSLASLHLHQLESLILHRSERALARVVLYAAMQTSPRLPMHVVEALINSEES